MDQDEIEREILRISLMAEFDAINLYRQFAEVTEDEDIKAIMEDVAKEEKEHVGEFQELLLQKDPEQIEQLEEGKHEVKEITKD